MEEAVEDLMAQRADLDRRIAAATLGPVEAALATLLGKDALAVESTLKEVIEKTTSGEHREQMGHVITVFDGVRTYLGAERTRLRNILGLKDEDKAATE